MSLADLPPLISEAHSVKTGALEDGTTVEIRLHERLVIVTLPTAETAARHKAAAAKRAAKSHRAKCRDAAVAACIANPKRSVASVARDYEVSAASLRRWIKKACDAA